MSKKKPIRELYEDGVLKAKDIFDELRSRKKGWFNLNVRLTFAVGAVVIISLLISIGIIALIQSVFPKAAYIPMLFQLTVISFVVALIVAAFISKIFLSPIKQLREGMQKIADGDFGARLENRSSSLEIQELIAGFNMMAQELEATEILQTDFVSNVSHEIKTPITAIEGYATLLQGIEGLGEEGIVYTEKILFNTERLSTLVGNILLLSKIENQSIQTKQTRYLLDEQIRKSVLAFENLWEKKDIEFDIDLERTMLVGNEALLRHVWDNLISNALKFSPNGGLVKMRLYNKNGKTVFFIEDHGLGISEEEKKHIFDKFYQGDSSHKQNGNGLGLALVKRILKIAGGEVFAENIDSGGCRFTVVLHNASD